MDAQSVKTTETARQSGYDAGKNVKGIKRHLAVDSEELPHAIEVTTADVNDRSGALLMFLLHQETLAEVTKVLVDGAYTGARFARLVWQVIGAKVEVVKRNELHTFAVLSQRWIVVSSFAFFALLLRRHRTGSEG